VTALSTPPRHTAGGGHATPASRWPWPLRGRPGDPGWVRPALLALLAATAVLYLAGLSRNGWANDFYAAAVQAGTRSWKAFLFGSFDSAGFITVDKTPASLWVMALSGRVFGFSSWSMLVPQALAGVAATGVLYATVRRWSGPAAGLIAGAILALTPVATLMFRFNNPDALLVLLLVLAAWATVRAVESGRTRWLALTGALLGFGYLTKMLQAFLLLPVFALVYLVAGPPRLRRRSWQLLAGGAALAAAAGWWVAIDLLTPAADRPYVGGSTTNNILQLTFGYNGLGRLTGNETGSVGPRSNGGGAVFGGSPGLGRLFGSAMGGQVSWLLPAALVALVALLWLSWRSPRAGRLRAAALLWGGWLVVTGLVFSYMSGIIHPYYTVALAPAIAALTGVGAVALWRVRGHLAARLTMVAMLAVTAGWSWVLLGRSAGWYPWLRIVIAVAALGAAGLILAGPALVGRRCGTHQAAGLAAGRGRLALAAAPVALAAVTGLAGPLAYSISTAATAHTGALPSAGPAVAGSFGPGGGFPGAVGRAFGGTSGRQPGSSGQAAGGQFTPPGGGTAGAGGTGGSASGAPAGGFPAAPGGQPGSGQAAGFPGGGAGGGTGGGPGGLGGNTQVSAALKHLLVSGASGYTWTAATVGSESAAPLELATGQPVMAIGGFNGTDPTPALAAFQKLVAEHKIHYFVGQNQASFGGGSGPATQITAWVKAHFTARTVGGVTVYDLSGGASS
jgi:4-amino-4-deoxy-L-arabinose transferase-like glycosyltransferase